MNFLSHFYFDRHTTDANRVAGIVLPDLIKNACKSWNIHPEKKTEKFFPEPCLSSILMGWERHLLVDKYFHSSDFFCSHTKNIRTAIAPVLESSTVRPSFVAHISLELMLDSLLQTESILNANNFYFLLNNSNRDALEQFLMLNNITETTIFFNFFEEFIEAAYLNSYREAPNIMYALNRICMRLWIEPFNETQKLQLTAALIQYQEELKKDFMIIFEQIEEQLN
jgi:acyl carrier protein phosphodiesterase